MRQIGRFRRVVGVMVLVAISTLPCGAYASGEQDRAADQVDASALPMLSLAALTPAEQMLLDLTNADRAAASLPPVAFDMAVLNVARTRAAEQLGTPGLSHYDASGGLVFASLLAADGVSYQLAGENLARGTGSEADPIFLRRIDDAWMQSPGHRKNILEPTFTQLAVGVAADESGQVALAQIFRAAR